ncbi:NAD(+) diphosphatase [Actinoalloteichus hymeniacidonis]|uniref:NAD(+) diphosphatase n=1 Tax=Actinoalloteichus hymeniacidonis TaxID=340345 RepID=A0AAC9HM33_9PSEU|nr:NAD(+) diphosphatase [Actinoalloteichus hymeniacidonis]AOS61804.1 Zn-finger containing NTP pyrophosphohydrolase [Actinoalloteichus hymeniacidonis]MBB5910177.1 NAD+ diphosphatase [Actinoalloteichus hymeniacidonis]
MSSRTEEITVSGPAAFGLLELPALSRSTVDRREPVRADGQALDRLWAAGRLLEVDPKGRARVRETGELVTAPIPADLARPDDVVLLGVQDDVGFWARRLPQEHPESGWQDLRQAGAALSDTDAGLLTTAVGLLAWHHSSGFCSVCGDPTRSVRAGWMRHCESCGYEHYPRTDPAVICLVHDGADRVLLARQPSWPAGRYSVLAGFVEMGESLEACVAREIAEEVGVDVSDISYLGSQPWPFPRSLMVGFAAVADPTQPLIPADGEIEAAFWVSRERVRTALAAGGNGPDFALPGKTSIAYRMLEGWAA